MFDLDASFKLFPRAVSRRHHLVSGALTTALLSACSPGDAKNETDGMATEASTTDPSTTDPSDTDPSDTDPPPGPTTTTGDPTEPPPDPTTTTVDPTEPPPSDFDCESVVGDHATAVCAGACPIAVDLELRCPEDGLARLGVRAAMTADETYVATSTLDRSLLLRADAEKFTPVPGATELFTGPLGGRLPLLALDAAGSPALAVDGTTLELPNSYSGGALYFSRDGDGAWAQSQAHVNPGWFSPVVDLRIDADGRPHLFFMTDYDPHAYAAAVRDGDAWTVHPVPVPQSPAITAFRRFALTGAGVEVAYAVAEERLQAIADGQTVALGSPPSSNFAAFQPALAPAPGPELVATLQLDEALEVAWASLGPDPQAGSVAVPGTALLQPTCWAIEPDENNECPDTCKDTAVGVDSQAFGFDRTADGTGWLAWVVTRLDQQYSYQWEDHGEGNLTCALILDSDATTSELHIARVPIGAGAPEEVLVMQLPALKVSDAFAPDTPDAPVELSASGSELALVVRLRDTGTNSSFLRLLRLDTSSLK